MSPRRAIGELTQGKLLDSWDPPVGAGDPIGVIATTFTFDAGFFEEELLARFLSMETSVDDGRAWLIEREERLGAAPAVVLADRRHVSRSTTLAWDLLAVPMPNATCFHAKVSLLAWHGWIRVIIGSANLTQPAFRRNWELYAVLDFCRDGEVPGSVLEAVLDFLKRCAERTPDPGGGHESPRGRAEALLARVRAHARDLALPTAWQRGGMETEAVFLEPDRGEGVLAQMGRLWRGGTRPNEVWVLSPFWSEPRSDGADPVVEALVGAMGRNGTRRIVAYPPGAEESDHRWVASLPGAFKKMEERLPRLAVDVRPVPVVQEGENRPLHAKAIGWYLVVDRRERETMVLIGSSNASSSGLGIASAPRNIEANLCFLWNGDRSSQRWLEQCFPDSVEPDEVHFATTCPSSLAEEGAKLPVPAFFQYAILRNVANDHEVEIGLGGDDEPRTWRVTLHNRSEALSSANHAEQGKPDRWVLGPLGSSGQLPSLVDVTWKVGDETHHGALPVNAMSSAERCRPDLWKDIDLDTLLALLAEGGPVYRHLVRILRGAERMSTSPIDPELDPHRRVDTSGFLMQRIRRISRALEGLAERLAAPVASEAALAWRFRGPLSPQLLGRRLAEAATDASEAAFLLAEVLLVVSRAAGKATCDGSLREGLRAAFSEALSELRAMIPESRPEGPLQGYVRRVLEATKV